MCPFLNRGLTGTLKTPADKPYFNTLFIYSGNANQVKPHYPEALVTYSPPQQPHTQPAFQRAAFYPSPQQSSYYPGQVRRYTPVQPRPRPVVQQRTFTQPQVSSLSENCGREGIRKGTSNRVFRSLDHDWMTWKTVRFSKQ